MATSCWWASTPCVFSLAGGEQAPMPEGEVDAFVPEIGGTMMLDTLKQKQMLSGLEQGRSSQMHSVIPKTTIPTPPARNGSVRVVSGKSDRSEYSLTAVTTIIGKADTAQIRTKGWFKPKVAAAIARKGEGFTVTPMGAAVTRERPEGVEPSGPQQRRHDRGERPYARVPPGIALLSG